MSTKNNVVVTNDSQVAKKNLFNGNRALGIKS